MNRPVSTDAALPFEQQQFRAEGVLSCDEIRWWIRAFAYDEEWGWSKNKANLARALGFKGHAAETMMGKLRKAWIYPTEQLRLSERIRLLRDGYVVPIYSRYPNSFEYVNPPRPPARKPTRMTVHTRHDGPRLTLDPPEVARPQMPDFRNVFKNARLWKTE